MQIDVRFRALEASDTLRAHAVERIHFHLSRFGPEVDAVAVRIGDVNGPKGGLDKHCRVTVRGRRLSPVVIDDLSGDAYAAVDWAVARAGRAVTRALERARTRRAS